MIFGIELEQQIRMSHKYIVECESEEKLNSILDEIENMGDMNFCDIVDVLDEKGATVVECCEDEGELVSNEFTDVWEEDYE